MIKAACTPDASAVQGEVRKAESQSAKAMVKAEGWAACLSTYGTFALTKRRIVSGSGTQNSQTWPFLWEALYHCHRAMLYTKGKAVTEP